MTIPSRSTIKEDLINLLRNRGSLSPSQAYRELSQLWNLTDEEKALKRSGDFLYRHEIRWARQELKIRGVIMAPDVSGQRRWTLADQYLRDAFENADEDIAEAYYEGAKKTVQVNIYERDKEARRKCFEHYGYNCRACKSNLETIYGTPGRESIHVHHIVQLSSIGENYEVDPINDLVPVCPNCHYIIHRRRPPYTIDEIRTILEAHSNQINIEQC